jgi:hypothetical protein
MIDPKQIPDEVVEAAIYGFYNATGPKTKDDWRAAIAAAINAWPGMVQHPPDELDPIINPDRIVLPFPQEGELKRLGPEFEAAIFSDVDSLYEADKSEGDA